MHAFDEVHDEDDLINNNVAYGLIEIGAAAFFDMGQAEETVYDRQSYSQTQTLVASVYMPLGNLSAVTRLDLKDSSLPAHGIGKPLELLAYQGEVDWGKPENEDFYLTEPGSNAPPAVITFSYSEADLTGKDAGSLMLYRLEGSDWQEANLTCGVEAGDTPTYQVQRFLEDNLIAVPVCQTGTYILSDVPVHTAYKQYLPWIGRP